MSTLIARLRQIADKRARYVRTVAELQAMPTEVAIDLGLFREDAHRLAARAVYGS